MRPRAALAVLAGLTLLHTWPLPLVWRVSLDHHADAQLNAWIVAWIPHALATQPLHLFDANIFAPEPRTLTYSEPLIVPALAGAPLVWAGVNPAIVLNVLTVAGLLLTAWSGWLVAWRWTGSTSAALVGGTLVAFNVHLLTRIPHLAAAHAWGLPLTLYLTDALVDRPSRRRVAQLAAVLALTAATSLYWFALAGIVVLIVLVTGARSRAAMVAIVAAGGLGLALALPVLLPYAQLAAAGSVRPIEMVRDFSATPGGYLLSTSRLHSLWSGPITNEVNVFFAGVIALGLAAVGAARAISASAIDRRRATVLLLLAVTGIVLSLGPTTALYRVLYDWFPPLRGLRAAARFGLLFLIAAGLLASVAVAWVAQRRPWIVAIAMVAATIEAWHGPVRTSAVPDVPAIYAALRDAPEPVMLVEVPFYPGFATLENAPYVFNSTAHWRPLMNGYSGFTPMSYRRRADEFWFFPDDAAIAAMRREGATHVMVHLSRFGAQAPDVERALASRTDLRLLAADRDRRRLYRFQ